MRWWQHKVVCGLLGALLASGGAARAADPAFGHWLTENGRSIVELAPCAEAPDAACGRIVWSLEPRHPDGRLKVDAENPDPARRSDPICGLTLLSGLAADRPGRWTDGKIYNPRDGKRYSVRVEADGDRLAVRGFLGLSLFGKTETWTREPGPRSGCPTE